MLKGILIALAILLAAGLLVWWLRKKLNWGPQAIHSPHFADHIHKPRASKFIADIQRDARLDHHGPRKDPMSWELRKMVARKADPGTPPHRKVEAHEAPHTHHEKILMLSGGGQWGAYGAGLFKAMHDASPDQLAMRNVKVITGISTGSLQTLLLMVALDGNARPELRQYAIERLEWGYSPKHESEVVDNRGMIQMLLRGAQAGTGPLRKRIRDAIYENEDATMLEAIRDSSIEGYIGFVEANCGLFHYADVRELVRTAPDNEAAVEALTAAAMASSAMPVFHQQLRVTGLEHGDRSLYDGGVRRSVFFERAVEEMHEEIKKRAGHPDDADPPGHEQAMVTPDFFVVRNGPTVRTSAPHLDASDNPLHNGKRGYDLLVNESEVGAIANLRLLNPHGDIWVTTADGWDNFDCQCEEADCSKEDEMFKPAFMACLRDLGRHKAQREGGPWWEMRKL
ncbi:patatin-like phospholipase family protein [Qipengyuania aurantiaca]|uniref:Patatin-like phospholipase family protein n=1 Tax=Qipengyuania aurantiaca TaxID=2867233 RepID=A0ABX8ZQG0_9SPHN|nr:patatin-like phospholipase family protein [Qipengyuania aurantiaca]QZD90991.1 patatin-like phospholipase family protein [Qipengyuania aurantiaca]